MHIVEIILLLVSVGMLGLGIYTVQGVMRAKWVDLYNPIRKHDNTNDEAIFPSINWRKTRSIFN